MRVRVNASYVRGPTLNVTLNQINQIDQTDEIDETDEVDATTQ